MNDVVFTSRGVAMVLLGVVVLAAVAGLLVWQFGRADSVPPGWHKSGATAQDFIRDHNSCIRDAGGGAAGLSSSFHTLTTTDEDLVPCMGSLGWVYSSSPP